jgi:FixJ family two-component response regulator
MHRQCGGNPVTDTPLIAIVDDDDAVLEATKDLVQTMGFRTETFRGANSFLAWNTAHPAACLILDVQMPGIDGFQLQQLLADAKRGIPIIFVTAFPDERMRRRALKTGSVAFLSKPFTRHELLHCIRLALGDKQSAVTG